MAATPLCSGLTDLFFSEDKQDQLQAQEVCSLCLLKDPCLQRATANGESAGVWGGHIFRAGIDTTATRQHLRDLQAVAV